MARFAPNLHHIFTELPPRERLPAAAAAGFDAVEWHFPYEIPKTEMKRLLDDNGLAFTYAVLPVDWSKELGLAGQPGRKDDFRRAAETGVDYLTFIGAGAMQVGAGVVPPGLERARCVETFVENLEWLARETKGSGLSLVIEGVCEARFPGWVIQTIGEAAEVLRRVGDPELKLVYDTFHLRMQERGPLATLLDQYWSLIGHVQIGNVPSRHEPGLGEIDLHFLIERLDGNGYGAPIGLEYDPSKDSWSSLGWMERYGYPPVQRPTGRTAEATTTASSPRQT